MAEEIKFVFDKVKSYLDSLELKDSKEYGPISLSTIEEKLESYASIDDFLQDLDLLAQNLNLYHSQELDLPNIISGFRKEYVDIDQSLPGPSLPSLTIEGVEYTKNDFVYFKSDPPFDEPVNYLIGQIKGCWNGGLRVNVFFRPWQIKYKSSQKFYKNEVVKSARNDDILPSAVTGKCYVQTVRDWCREKVDCPEEDSYVLESRYHIAAKLMTKIKNWGGIEVSSGQVLDEPRVATRQVVESPLPDVDFGNIQISQSSGTGLRKRKKDSFVSDEGEPLRKRSVPIVQPERQILPSPDLKGFNFNSMGKTTKDLIMRLHSQRPMFMVPQPTSQKTLPGAVIKALGGDVKWFKAPPLDRVDNVGLSKVYLKYLADNVRKGSKNGKPVENVVDIEMEVDQVDQEQVAPSVESLVKVLKEFEKTTMKNLFDNKL